MVKKAKADSSGVPDNETDSERFIRVVTPRVGKAIKAIGVIGFCAGSTYNFTQVQVDHIIQELEITVKELSATFAGDKGGGSSFKFK